MKPSEDPCWRFLGVAADAAPWEVLGLADADASATEIAAAIRRRWAQIDADPDAGSPAARSARRAVTEAAKRMPNGARRRPRPSPPIEPETQLDGELVGAIRAARGRRAELATRLAAIGRRRGLAADAIVEQLRSLQGSAPRRLPLPRQGAETRRSPIERQLAGLLDRLEVAERRGGEDRAAPVSRIGVAIGLPAAALVLAGVLVAIWMHGRSGRSSSPPAAAMLEAAAPSRPLPLEAGHASLAEAEAFEERVAGDPPLEASASLPLPPPAAMGWPESFDLRASAAPGDAEGEQAAAVAAALSDAASVPSRLEDLAQRIRGERGELTPSLETAWAELQRIAGDCWPLLSPSLRRSILNGSHACLQAIDSWRAAASLVAAVSPRSLPPVPPRDLWQGAWRAGLLGDLAARGDLPPLVREELQRELGAIALPRRGLFTGRTPFEETAARWLVAASAELAATPLEDARSTAWWWWIAASESIAPATLREAVQVAGLRRLLEAWEDGTRPTEPSVRRAIAEALLARIDPMMPESPALVRSTLLDLIGGGSLPLRAASVLADSLRQVPGFDASSALPPLDGRVRRGDLAAWAEAAGRLWPAGRSARGTRVDGMLLERWDRLREGIAAPIRGSDAAVLDRVVQAGRLAESAARIGDDPARARQLLDAIEREAARERAAVADPPLRAGRREGVDGEWAEAMTAALADPPMRIELLRRLRNRGGDLGPLDAEAIVRAAIADGPQVRTVAAAMLLEQFGDGPQVLRALLGRLDGRGIDESFAELLARLVEGDLPPWEDPRFQLEARRGVIERLLAIEPSELRRIDQLGERYAATVGNLADALGFASGPSAGPDPVEAAARLADGLLLQLDAGARTAIAERRSLRRRLAEHPPARLVAEQAAVAESLAALRDRVAGGTDAESAAVLETFAMRRAAAATSLEQLLAGAIAIADLVRLDLRASRGIPGGEA